VHSWNTLHCNISLNADCFALKTFVARLVAATFGVVALQNLQQKSGVTSA